MSAAFSAIMIDRRVDVAADQVGHHRGVDHAQPLDAAHPQLRIDHRDASLRRPSCRCRAGGGAVIAVARMCASRSRRRFTSGPGASSRADERRQRRLRRNLARTMRRPARSVFQSARWTGSSAGCADGARGSAEASVNSPRLSGCSITTRQPKPSAKGGLNGGRYGPAVMRRGAKQELDVGHVGVRAGSSRTP